ncbi:MAG: hypothetical protein M3463_11895 [Verrucomicrobiota bacterium]|nr:hypothetical protein [Verrucomicrobiota bacterium]
MRPAYVKQYGLPRSGTNYLCYLLRRNYELRVLVNETGWKHGMISTPAEWRGKLLYLVTAKNPYSWLVSMHRFARKHPMMRRDVPFAEFLREPFVFRGRAIDGDNPQTLAMRAANPVQFWNDMLFHWLEFLEVDGRGALLRYEDLLRDPETKLNGVVGAWRGRRPFEVPTRELKPSWDEHRPGEMLGTKVFPREVYLEERWREAYTEDHLAFVDCHLDAAVMAKTGYAGIGKE